MGLAPLTAMWARVTAGASWSDNLSRGKTGLHTRSMTWSLRVAAVCLVLSGAALAQPAPEAASGRSAKTLVTAKRHMMVAANPHAVEAGHAMLVAGGSAVDAAIAAQLVLNLVEPQSSGIGGGAFLVLWSAADRRVSSFDGRETAPMAAKPDRFLSADGKPLGFREAVVGGRSVGAPGALRMLELAHRKHGKLPWARLFEPAIALAEGGFPMSPRLNRLLTGERDLGRDEAARAIFYADGAPKPVGAPIANAAFADTLRLVARDGADALHSGALAADIVATVSRAGGDLSLEDLQNYRAKERPAVCGSYRVYVVCGMGPPSSGGLTVLQILTLLEGVDLAPLEPNSAEAVHLIGEAMALGYADRNLYMADADFVPVPTGLTDRAYLRDRAALIARNKTFGKAAPGTPPQRQGLRWGEDASPELPATSHIAIVDADGNALSMTTTIEDAFGSRLMVRGFLLNNQLTDFSFLPEQDGKPVANRVEPGKRPRSSMAPTIVLQDGAPVLVLGSPGGSAIINYVVKTAIGVLDWNLDVQRAIDLPNFGNRNVGAIELERGTPLVELKPALEALGHRVAVADFTSGLHAIRIFPDRLEGGADPRREGMAKGD
jgi:gamma-glutamyltranspeptidase / glutathione hydrolase